jgi:hypothetical protein
MWWVYPRGFPRGIGAIRHVQAGCVFAALAWPDDEWISQSKLRTHPNLPT